MGEVEECEGSELSPSKDELEGGSTLSEDEKCYIGEVLDTKDSELIAARIDELDDSQPPRAIDSNKEISELLGDGKENIDNKYLEAPNDMVQVEQASEAMKAIEGTDYESWEKLTVEERLETLQKVENSVADIAHRPPCEIVAKSLGENHFGYYDPQSKTITLNSDYLESDRDSYKESLDTVLHEGRHAYQDYNLSERQVHSSKGDLTNWRWNQNICGYQDPQTCGFKNYWMQPVEADARKFAEDVIYKFKEKS